MTRNIHDRARELIALAGAGAVDRDRDRDRDGDEGRDLAGEQQTWVLAHLQECAACRDYQEAAGRAVRAVRSQPLAAGSALVRATQMRVRARALELRQQQERMWLVCLSCLSVGLSAAITTPLFWRAFAWMGAWAGVSNWVWQSGFTFFWMAPALVASVLLLARGTHLSSNGGVATAEQQPLSSDGEQQWR
jgi:predicted anti-sigma-YlaC factor YlaD